VRLGVVPETPLEWLALRSGRIPTPLVDTHLAVAWGRTLLVATRVGVFESLARGPATASAVAADCDLAPLPTRRLLDALTGMGTLVPVGTERYRLGRQARRWLVRSSPHEVIDKVLFAFDEWRFVEHYERYVRRAEPLGMHALLVSGRTPDPAPPPAISDPDAYGRYQRGLYALAGVSVTEVARRTPVPAGATALLDLGGAHGRFAAALLRRHPELQATVLDLAPAVAVSAPLLARQGLGPRLAHRIGDVQHVDLGEDAWDVVLASQLTHHLDDEDNRALARRVARSLRPGGVYVVQDLVRPANPAEARRMRLGALLDLYFAATSGAGTSTLAAMRAWFEQAGLAPARPRWLRTLPGVAQLVGRRLPLREGPRAAT
jgi:SAM-dependent methyltransferase